MNCTLSRPTSTELNENVVQDYMTIAENAYTTKPMVAVKLIHHSLDEEELHTSFEEAISERLIALHGRLERISRPLSNTQDRNTDPALSTFLKNSSLALEPPYSTYSTEQLVSLQSSHPVVNNQQRIAIFACFALMFMLLGFDLMGLLVIHMH